MSAMPNATVVRAAWRRIFQGFSRLEEFVENPRSSSFHEGLPIDSIFSLIHLDGQYL